MYDIEDETQCSDTGRREGLLVSDSEGAIVKTTESVERMTGYTMEDLLAMQLSDLFWTPNMDDSGGSLGATLSGTNGPARLVLDCADGTHATVELCSHTVSPDTQTRVYTTLRSPTGADSLATPPINGASMAEAEALRQLHRQAMEGTGVADTAERLLALGRDYLGLEDGALARIDDGTYEVAYTAGEAEAYEPGLSVPVSDTVAEGVATDSAAGPLVFVEAAGTATQGYPLTDAGGTYVGAPVVVEGEMYGVVEFTGPGSHEETVGQNEREFVELLAQWIGHEIERDRRIKQLERYETVLEAVDDPVYALDTDARFTFVNEAAQREFGYGQDIIGEHVSIGMDKADIQRVAGQRQELVETDARSKTAQFELETADGGHRLVENRLALIGEQGFEGTAGVLRDVTDREQRRRQLESFQQAIEEAADGVAILEGDEYVYVDQTHVELYGFDSRDQLLGNTWRTLYGDDEIERLEAEAFPALESDGYWRGMVTGTRPDGSQFPAELSLTIVDDGRLVCTVRDETERLARKRDLELKERAMDETDVSIQITDPTQEGNPLIYVNEGFERLTGYTNEEALGRNPRFLQGPETRPEQVTKLREAIANEEPVTVELQNHRADGTGYWAKLSITPVYDDDGTLTNFIGIQQDVTQRRKLVETLKARTERLDLALSETGTGIVEWDLEADEIIWDDTLAEVLGQEPRMADEFFDLVHPADRADIEADLDQLLETGEPFRAEFRIRTGDDEAVWLETRNVLVSENGEPARVLATGADVTERKERQEALVESQQRYQTLLRAAPDPVFLADAETGEIVETNAAAAALRGESRDDIVGRNQSDLHPGGDADAYRTVLEDAVGAKTMVSELPDGSQLELCTADGEAVPVEINADTVDLPQGEMIYGVFRDISDRVEKQRELELKERAMDEANVGITISDPDRPDNPLIYVNKGFVDQTGYSREAVLGRNCRFLQQDEQDQPSLDTLRDAIASEEPVTVELRNYRKDGEQFWNRLSVTPVYNEAEQLVNYIGIQHDVTNERTIAQRLRTLHGTTRDLLETDDITDAATVAVETICQQLDVAVAEVYRRDAEELVRLVSRGSESLATPAQGLLDPTPAWDAIESDGLVVSETDESPITTTAYFPIEGHGVVAVGVRDPAELDDSTRQLMEILTGNLVAVLDTFERNRELTRERERFQLLTESVDEYAFLIVDEDGDIATWNDGAASLFGYDAETAVGMSTAQLHPPPDRESGLTERLLQQARTAGESAHEGTRVRADGSEFYADVRYAPLETDDGEFRGYAKIVRDMTERRRQQRRTERFVEQADDVVTVLDTDGTVTYASGSAERVLGYEPDDIVGENLFDYLHPDGREHAMRTFNDCVDGEADVQAECRLRAPDGGWFNVEGRCRNMLDDDAVDGILVYLRDVTDIKERARRFESLFNQTYQFTGLLEPDGTVIETNEAALDFGGLDRTEIVGESFADAPWWTHSEDMNDRVRNAIQRAGEGEFVRYETEVWGSQGVGIIDFSVKPVTDEDGAVSMLVVEGRDITEQNRRREHLQVIQRVMRHNMRNDLTKLRGFTEALYKFTDAESATKYFERIEAILDKWTDMTEMASQIRQVLEGQQHSEASTGAGELVDDAAAVADGMAVETTVTNDLPGQAAPEIPALMTEAVRELIENAAEAASGPDAQVTVTLSRADDNWVDITVADNGPGLPDEEARVLRTGEETSLTHGQGLGLWMVRMLTKQVGGNVSVDVADDGTTVTLQIPTSDHLSIES